MKAIERADKMYSEAGKNFDSVLSEHLNNGIVISSPMWFLMLRIEKLSNGEPVWFVECAVGRMRDLANLVSLRLPFISFCRVKAGKKQTKTYPFDRLMRLAKRDIVLT